MEYCIPVQYSIKRLAVSTRAGPVFTVENIVISVNVCRRRTTALIHENSLLYFFILLRGALVVL